MKGRGLELFVFICKYCVLIKFRKLQYGVLWKSVNLDYSKLRKKKDDNYNFIPQCVLFILLALPAKLDWSLLFLSARS